MAGSTLVESLRSAEHRSRVAGAEVVAVLAEMARRDTWKAQGCTSFSAFVVRELKVPWPLASALVEVASVSERCPLLFAAYRDGEVSFEQLRALAPMASAEDDARLAEGAPRWSMEQTRLEARRIETARADAERRRAEAARREAQAEVPAAPAPPSTPAAPVPAPALLESGPPVPIVRRASLRLHPVAGGGVVEAWFPVEQYALVHQVLSTGAEARWKEKTPYPERLAATLYDALCAPGPTDAEHPRPHLVVHADLAQVKDLASDTCATVEGAGPVGADVLRRLACEASVRLATEENGATVDLGRRTRVPSAALVAEVRRRDLHCRFPGCGRTRGTEIHHICHWADGGRTDLSNLVTTCGAHHHQVHHGGWALHGDANATLTWTSPQGTVATSEPAPTWRPQRNLPRRA